MQVVVVSLWFMWCEDVDLLEVDKEREIYCGQVVQSGKFEVVIDKIVVGKVEKFYVENCLVEQEYICDISFMVGKLVEGVSKKVGVLIEVICFV